MKFRMFILILVLLLESSDILLQPARPAPSAPTTRPDHGSFRWISPRPAPPAPWRRFQIAIMPFRRLHLVRPDLIQYPMDVEVYC